MKNNDFNKLFYTRVIQEMNDESGHYFYGKILELNGCQSTGDTVEELHKNLSEAIELYLEVKAQLQ